MKLDVTKLAREAGYGEAMAALHGPALERFAAAVVEECAKVCDEYADDPVYCGNAIRELKEPE